jgi:hypothetical protein
LPVSMVRVRPPSSVERVVTVIGPPMGRATDLSALRGLYSDPTVGSVAQAMGR